ncbi:MAG: ABC transporter ATP-binding protein [Clostridiales bacterium]|nr:ABC transporter ATP-binding protein [Clostridiales bacterium]
MILQVNNLTKKYGDNTALNNVSADFTNGIYGILGPNGSGKSTLFNIITDNISLTSGAVMLDGVNIAKLKEKYRQIIGYMPQQQGFYEDFTVNMFLRYFAKLKGMKKSDANAQIPEILKIVNLEGRAKDKIKSLSGGMKQRVLFAQALLNSPQILILDEPTAGLDPKERINFRNMLAELSKDKIILLATHIVSDVECIADRVMLLKKGNLIQNDTPESLMKSIAGKVFEIRGTKEELLSLQHSVGLGNIIHDQNGIALRIVTDNPAVNAVQHYGGTFPADFTAEKGSPKMHGNLPLNYVPVKDNVALEDVYLYYFEYLK